MQLFVFTFSMSRTLLTILWPFLPITCRISLSKNSPRTIKLLVKWTLFLCAIHVTVPLALAEPAS